MRIISKSYYSSLVRCVFRQRNARLSLSVCVEREREREREIASYLYPCLVVIQFDPH